MGCENGSAAKLARGVRGAPSKFDFEDKCGVDAIVDAIVREAKRQRLAEENEKMPVKTVRPNQIGTFLSAARCPMKSHQ